MALINRMSRLLTADIHAVLDRIEEPEALLRQAIREMEEELASAERRTRRLEQEREGLVARRAKLEASITELDGQLDVCFEAGNDALGRKLVRRKLEAERLGRRLTDKLEDVDKAVDAQRATLVERREQLDIMRQKSEVLSETAEPERTFTEDSVGFVVGDDEVEVAFLRERQRRKPS